MPGQMPPNQFPVPHEMFQHPIPKKEMQPEWCIVSFLSQTYFQDNHFVATLFWSFLPGRKRVFTKICFCWHSSKWYISIFPILISHQGSIIISEKELFLVFGCKSKSVELLLGSGFILMKFLDVIFGLFSNSMLMKYQNISHYSFSTFMVFFTRLVIYSNYIAQNYRAESWFYFTWYIFHDKSSKPFLQLSKNRLNFTNLRNGS